LTLTATLLLALAGLVVHELPEEEEDFGMDLERAVDSDRAERYWKKYKEVDSKLRVTRVLLLACSSTSRLQCTLINSLKRLLVQNNIEIPSQLASLTMAVRPPSFPSTT
jgi:hypothetical protein